MMVGLVWVRVRVRGLAACYANALANYHPACYTGVV